MADARPRARSQGVIGGFLSLSAGEIAARVVAFVGTTYLTRTLGPDGFGILGLAAALCGYASLAVRAGFDDVGAREVARSPKRAAEVAAGATAVRLLLAVVAMSLVLLIAAFLPKPPIVRLVVVLTGLSFFTLALDTGWVHKGLGKSGRVGAALVAGQTLYVGAILFTVHRPEDILFVPIAQIGGELGAAALLLAPLMRRGIRPDLREGVRILRASGFVTLSRLLRTVIYTFDVVLIGLWLGEYEVGLYTAAYRLCFLILAVATALHVAYLPAFAVAHGTDDRRALAERAVGLSMALAIPMLIGGSLLAEPMLERIFGAEYAAAAVPFRLLLLSLVFIFVSGTIHNLMLVLGRTRQEMFIIAFAAALNIALNIVAIPRYGLVGAAAATVAAEATVVVLGLTLVTRAGIRIRGGGALGRTALATGTMALGLLAIGIDAPLVATVGGGALLYAVTLTMLGAVPPDIEEAFGRADREPPG